MNANHNLAAVLFGLLASVPLFGQPTIATQPADQSVCLHDPAQFRVAAGSSGGLLTFQWWFKDTALDPALNPSAAKSTLLLTNVTDVMAGSYWAVIADGNGSATSLVAHLTLDPAFVRVLEPGFPDEAAFSYGCAWADYDNDGFSDLFVANGGGEGRRANALHGNNGNGTFSRRTAAEAGAIVTDLDDSVSCAWGDADNDGFLDLIVCNGLSSPARSQLYVNDGRGGFRAAAAGDLTNLSHMASSTSWGDYDADGLLDVFMAVAYNGTRRNLLLQNRGDGTFRRVIDSAVTTDEVPCSGVAGGGSMDSAWGDFDNDGLLDLVVPNWGCSSFLYHNLGNGEFVRLENSAVEASTSSVDPAWGDYDNDGDLDLAMAMSGQTRLYGNEGEAGFQIAQDWPLAASRYNGYPTWADYDNDGDLDLFISRGAFDPVQSLLYRNNGDGTFDAVTGGIAGQSAAWVGCGWGDFDNDGFMDLFVTERHGRNVLYRNGTNANHWLKVKLTGTASNRAAIGAKVRVKATIAGKTVRQMREISGGAICQDDLRPNFGLGNATQADLVRIEWPSGIVQELPNVPANQILIVTEPARLQALGAGRVRIQCWKGQKFEAEASNDLVTWTSLGLFTNETGTLEFTDPDAGQQAWRFYRAVSRQNP
jgi:enediyne biosynthesis protein E4